MSHGQWVSEIGLGQYWSDITTPTTGGTTGAWQPYQWKESAFGGWDLPRTEKPVDIKDQVRKAKLNAAVWEALYAYFSKPFIFDSSKVLLPLSDDFIESYVGCEKTDNDFYASIRDVFEDGDIASLEYSLDDKKHGATAATYVKTAHYYNKTKQPPADGRIPVVLFIEADLNDGGSELGEIDVTTAGDSERKYINSKHITSKTILMTGSIGKNQFKNSWGAALARLALASAPTEYPISDSGLEEKWRDLTVTLGNINQVVPNKFIRTTHQIKDLSDQVEDLKREYQKEAAEPHSDEEEHNSVSEDPSAIHLLPESVRKPLVHSTLDLSESSKVVKLLGCQDRPVLALRISTDIRMPSP